MITDNCLFEGVRILTMTIFWIAKSGSRVGRCQSMLLKVHGSLGNVIVGLFIAVMARVEESAMEAHWT